MAQHIQNAKTFIGWGRTTATKNDQVIVIATLLYSSSHTLFFIHIQPSSRAKSSIPNCFCKEQLCHWVARQKRRDMTLSGWLARYFALLAAWLVTQPTNYVGCSFLLLHTTVEAFSQDDDGFPILSVCHVLHKSEFLARQRRMQNGLTTWLYDEG